MRGDSVLEGIVIGVTIVIIGELIKRKVFGNPV